MTTPSDTTLSPIERTWAHMNGPFVVNPADFPQVENSTSFIRNRDGKSVAQGLQGIWVSQDSVFSSVYTHSGIPSGFFARTITYLKTDPSNPSSRVFAPQQPITPNDLEPFSK